MSVYYNGEHSITFWNLGEQYATGNPFNTWEDFHLIPLSRPYVVEPEANVHVVPIAGTNKRIDITDRLPGGLTYGKRSGQWEFAIDHGQYSNWASSYRSILNFFHGKKMMVSLNDNPAKIYYGFITVTGYNPGSDYTTVTLQYDLDKGYYDFTDVLNPKIPSSRFPTDIDLLQRVRFYGLNNSLLDESYYRIGDAPRVPSIPDEANYDFKYWNPSIQLVNGSIDYHAVYEYISDSSGGGGGGEGGGGGGGDADVKVKYRFLYNGTVITEGEIEKNQTPPTPNSSQVPAVDDYSFIGWKPDVGPITEDTDYEAQYENGKLIEGTYINYVNDVVERIEAYAFYKYAFNDDIGLRLVRVSFANAKYIGEYAFGGCNVLTHLILGSSTIVELANSNAIPSGCYVFVPSDLVDSYKSAANWSSLSGRIRSIS